jgi:hypothetical protein|tara:strand:- start:13199 stop:13747 length:549 start_codon:yes stop_codon:yes gene_type:complete
MKPEIVVNGKINPLVPTVHNMGKTIAVDEDGKQLVVSIADANDPVALAMGSPSDAPQTTTTDGTLATVITLLKGIFNKNTTVDSLTVNGDLHLAIDALESLMRAQVGFKIAEQIMSADDFAEVVTSTDIGLATERITTIVHTGTIDVVSATGVVTPTVKTNTITFSYTGATFSYTGSTQVIT